MFFRLYCQTNSKNLPLTLIIHMAPPYIFLVTFEVPTVNSKFNNRSVPAAVWYGL